MKTLITAATAVLYVTAEPAATATDRCDAAGDRLCTPAPPGSQDILDTAPEAAIVAPPATEQAPPPASMPPGRGMTYAMEQDAAYWPNHSAVYSSVPQYRNAALLDLPGGE